MGKNTPDRQEFIIKNLKELDVAEAVCYIVDKSSSYTIPKDTWTKKKI
jgi:hypothetical protein